MTTTKQYAPNIGFWPASNGNGFTVKVNAEMAAMLSKVQVGSVLHLTTNKDPQGSQPHIRVAVLPPTERTAPSQPIGL